METEDSYILVLMHLKRTGDLAASANGDGPEKAKGVILLHHGSSMDGLSWFATENESLPSKLIKAGFDVWLSNDRGTANS